MGPKLSVAMATKPKGRLANFYYTELPFPKQHLYQIRVILLLWFWLSFKKNTFLKFNVAMATKQKSH